MTPKDPISMYADLEAHLTACISPQPFSAAHNLRLERITALLQHLDHPHHRFPVVHVGGTSGKGSTAAFTEAIVRHHGRRTGLHMSPHLQLINERHQLNGRPAPTSALLDCWPAVARAIQDSTTPPFGAPSYFEVQLALSLLLFARKNVDIAVVEVGVGGERDATNVLPAAVAVLTNVGLDHTELLGDTPLKIATDKAGIIKPGQRVFSAVTQPEVVAHIRDRCHRQGATLNLLGEDITVVHHRNGSFDIQLPEQRLTGLCVGMQGDFQIKNAALAMGAARAILGQNLHREYTQAALDSVHLPGRAERVQDHPCVILDGAHNPDKVTAAAQLLGPRSTPRIAVVALKSGKDAKTILSVIAQHVDQIILTQFRDKGLWTSTPPRQLQRLLPDAKVVLDPDEAVTQALMLAGREGMVWVTGSLYLIGDVRGRWAPPAMLLHDWEQPHPR